MVIDPIGDMLTQIRNAGMSHKDSITLPYSKLRFAVAQALLKNGYVRTVTKKGKKTVRLMEIGLLYSEGKPRVTGAQRVSKPSRRVYTGSKDITPVRHGYGMLVLSTPKGILTGGEAKKLSVGGEVLFKIW
jgi:small subunit ribosomal protein S8